MEDGNRFNWADWSVGSISVPHDFSRKHEERNSNPHDDSFISWPWKIMSPSQKLTSWALAEVVNWSQFVLPSTKHHSQAQKSSRNKTPATYLKLRESITLVVDVNIWCYLYTNKCAEELFPNKKKDTSWKTHEEKNGFIPEVLDQKKQSDSHYSRTPNPTTIRRGTHITARLISLRSCGTWLCTFFFSQKKTC